MKFSIHNTISDLDTLAGEWNDLLEQSAIHVPFLRYEYLRNWWQTLGGGEWKQGKLFVVSGRDAENTLRGIAPLFFTENRSGEPALMLLGSIEISDYLDLIVRPADVSAFVDGLLAYLDTVQGIAWGVLDWYNLLEDSPTLTALRSAAQKMGWEFTLEQLQPAPYIPLPEDRPGVKQEQDLWEVYLAGIDKKQRHEIRRKIRRAETNDLPVRWYIVEDEADLDKEVDAFLELMVQDPAKASFLTETMRRQMHATAQTMFQAGWLQLAFLEVGEQKAAGYFNFDYKNHIWVYNSGLNFEQAHLSPGWVLLAYLLQWAIQQERTCFDFMRGNEIYKYRFGALNRYVTRAILRR